VIARNILDWSAGGQHRATSLTEDDFYRFRKWLVDAALADKTVHDRGIVFKQMLRWAVSRKLLAQNPFADIRLSKPVPTPQPVLTAQQVGILLQQANAHMRPIIATLAWTGMRIGELAELRWADLQTNDHGQAFFVISEGGSTPGKTKGRHSRDLPINPQLMDVLGVLPRDGERIFTAMPTTMYPQTGRPVNERRVLASFKQLCRKCGFENWRKLKLHTLRHTFASIAVQEGLSERYVLEFMGHRSSAILDHYVHTYDAAAHAAICAIKYPMSAPNRTKEKTCSGE
jgi:integrase